MLLAELKMCQLDKEEAKKLTEFFESEFGLTNVVKIQLQKSGQFEMTFFEIVEE